MTKTNMDLTDFLKKYDQGDLLRSIAEAVLQLMTESDVDGLIGATCATGGNQTDGFEAMVAWRSTCPDTGSSP